MIDLRQLQQMLTPEQQILEYFWGDSIIAILSITKENCHFDIQKNTGDFRLKLEQLFNWILSDTVLAASNSQQRYRRFAELSHEVYRVLLGNLRDPQKSTLLISPDGLLSQMPFEMLITNKDGQDFRAAPYLLREVNIQYAFSSNLHFKLDDHQRVSKPSVLAFAYSDQRTDHSSEVRNQMMEIPESGMEVKRIRKILGGTKSDYFTGTDATESNFKQNLDDQDIIHLALHGIGDVESELNSRLIFRPDGDEENDGWLYTHELYSLDLSKVRMAVLSACETGIGKEYPGEGMFSMAHGFARSGCSGVVMSLWQAVDANTAEVMDFFYQNIKAGLGSAEALRQAKLQYLDETEYSMNTPPYYWAAFVHIGDANPIVNTKTYPAIFWMLAILLIAILIYVLTKRLN
jgi:CHAT domain-containing protein